jgi:hypothetical protein
MIWKIGTCAVALAMLLAIRNPAKADILFSNIAPSSQDGADSITSVGPNMFGPLADSFSTPARALNLTDVMVNLTGTPDAGSLSIDLLSDNPTPLGPLPTPGAFLTHLGTVFDSSFNGTLQTFDFPQAPFALSPSTRYWVQLSSTTTSGTWNFSFDISGPGVATEFYANEGGVSFPNSDGPYEMQVSAGVPEPNSLVLAILGISALAFRTSSRRVGPWGKSPTLQPEAPLFAATVLP